MNKDNKQNMTWRWTRRRKNLTVIGKERGLSRLGGRGKKIKFTLLFNHLAYPSLFSHTYTNSMKFITSKGGEQQQISDSNRKKNLTAKGWKVCCHRLQERKKKFIKLIHSTTTHHTSSIIQIIIQESDFEPRLQGGVKEKKRNSPRSKRACDLGQGRAQNFLSSIQKIRVTIQYMVFLITRTTMKQYLKIWGREEKKWKCYLLVEACDSKRENSPDFWCCPNDSQMLAQGCVLQIFGGELGGRLMEQVRAKGDERVVGEKRKWLRLGLFFSSNFWYEMQKMGL